MQARSELITELPRLLAEQRERISRDNLFGDITESIGESRWGKAPKVPIDEHPRLLIRRENLPLIRKRLTDSHPQNEVFRELADCMLESKGKLAEVEFHSVNVTVNIANIHNFEVRPLTVIQAKALNYLITEDSSYGYEAILYLKNFLLTLNIKQIASDQCRQYGYLMYTAALVYDWCYDLLTDEDKKQIIAGVEHRVCRMRNDMTKREGQVVLEVGFPPSGQGAIVGHGSERQILRDYLSFATAIWGENNSWWDYIAARVYNDYVPPRNYYYRSGVAPQGPYYGEGRHISDVYSAWILKVATGENPYVGMENVTRGFLGYEYADGMIFSDGDGHSGDGLSSSDFGGLALMIAYLYGDAEMLAWGNHLFCEKTVNEKMTQLSTATFLALRGLRELEPAEDRYKGMSLIQYNGSPLGQYIIRDGFARNDGASVFMRGKERTTGNHEHGDTGTFEIYYKGMLTNRGGVYCNYGHAQTAQYYRKTISHNGIVIFNPLKWDFASEKADFKWYSGSQIRMPEPNRLDILLSKSYDMSSTVGRQHAYLDKEEKKPHYAYIASDMSLAYDRDTASHVERRMLTVFTGDPDYPMALFVYDDVETLAKGYEKRFLLQISSSDAPEINEAERTVTTEKGGGRLVMKSISEDVFLRPVGGRNEGDYNSSESRNYVINDHQCPSMRPAADDKHWGRVEAVWSKPTERAELVTLLYVTDKGQTKPAPRITKVAGDGITGCVYGRTVALFATSRERRADEINVKVPAPESTLEYFVSGIAEGEWTVTVDGKKVGSFEASAEGGLLVFKAPAGEVVISPAN